MIDEILKDCKIPFVGNNDGVIFQSDCLDIMPLIPDNSIDCFVSDVPYKLVQGGVTGKLSAKITGVALNFENQNTKNGNGNFNHNDIKFKDWLPNVYRILKEKSHCYIMVNDRNLQELMNEATKNKFKLLNVLIWNKNNAMPNHWYMKNAEFICMFRKGGAKYINNQGSKQIIKIDNVIKKNHPTEKPIDLMKILIENSTNENDIVIDTFMGTGSTILACKDLKRKFIGIEKESKYFDIACQRLQILKDEKNENIL
jgi:site-specific DNA-methyltransferase (adenine-specific)